MSIIPSNLNHSVCGFYFAKILRSVITSAVLNMMNRMNIENKLPQSLSCIYFSYLIPLRKSILEMKKDHEDQVRRLKKLKDEEIDAVTSATSQTR